MTKTMRVVGAATALLMAGVLATWDPFDLGLGQPSCFGEHEAEVRVSIEPVSETHIRWVIGEDQDEKTYKHKRYWFREGIVDCGGEIQVGAVPKNMKKTRVTCTIKVDGVVVRTDAPRFGGACGLRHSPV